LDLDPILILFLDQTPRIVLRWDQDPKAKAWWSPYSVLYDMPAYYKDPNGDCPFVLVAGGLTVLFLLNSTPVNAPGRNAQVNNAAMKEAYRDQELDLITDFIPGAAVDKLFEMVGAKYVVEKVVGSTIIKYTSEKVTEITGKIATHIFSGDHIEQGILKLGKTKQDILEKIDKIVSTNLPKLKEGQNFIYEEVNGKVVTVTAQVEKGTVISVNASVNKANTVRKVLKPEKINVINNLPSATK
jgi:hypothetical protein